MTEFTEEEMQKAHEQNGGCNSCGWHAMFSEHSYTRTHSGQNPDEFHDYCKSPEKDVEGEDNRHRGCYIYPEKTTPPKQN